MKKYFIPCLILFVGLAFGYKAHAMENPDLEGWIVKIDADKSMIRVLSANPEGNELQHDRSVLVKYGWINDFKMNDYVQVKFRKDLRHALMIEKTEPKVGQQAQPAQQGS